MPVNYAAIFWVCAIVLFAIVEGLTAGLVSIWFVAGSVASLICAAFGGKVWFQALLFIIVSAAAIVLTRPLVKRYANPKKVSTNADRVLEQVGIVTQTIDNIAGTGLVKVGGIDWTSRSVTGDVIAEGVLVRAQRIEGVKLYVTAVEQKEETADKA